MIKKVVAGLGLLTVFLAVRAPASVWDSVLREVSQGNSSLLDTQGSLWAGQAVLGVLDPEAGVMRAVMPLGWQWHPARILRGHLAWDFSLAGSPPFRLEAGMSAFSLSTLRVSLPARFAMERIPNTLARAGWQGDWLINIPAMQCSWQRKCSGDISARWEAAASDLFPGRTLGNYRLDINARDGVLDMRVNTEGGDVRITAAGKLDEARRYQVSGTISGDPAFVNRIPNVASQYVQRSATPGLLNFSVQGVAR